MLLANGTGEMNLQHQKKLFWLKTLSLVITPTFYLQMTKKHKYHIILLYIVMPSAAHQLNKCLNMKKVGWVKPPLWSNLPSFP